MHSVILLSVFIVICGRNLIGALDDIESFDTNYSGKDVLNKFGANFRYHVLGDEVFNEVLSGPGDWLNFIGELSLDDYQNVIPFTDAELTQIQSNLDAIQKNLAEKQIKFYVVVPPNKNTIYPEMLPTTIPIIGEKSRLSQLMEYQETTGNTKIIDLREPLLEKKRTDLIYGATDSHWNAIGAWVGYYELMSRISLDFPQIIPHKLEEYRIAERTVSGISLAELAGELQISDTVIYLSLVTGNNVESEQYTVDGINYIKSSNSNPNLPTAVIFRDSFFMSLQPLVADHFSESTYVWGAYDQAVVDEIQPDIVIYEVTERYLYKLLQLP